MVIGPTNFTPVLILAAMLPLASSGAVPAQSVEGGPGERKISADRIIDNPDSSVTFIRPWVAGQGDRSGQRLEIRRGVPGACRLFGLDDFLRGHVVWSKNIEPAVSIAVDGTIGEVEPGYYIESMTCITGSKYVPVITVDTINSNADGSVTVIMPMIYNGTEKYMIVSGFSAGACRLLGYNSVIQYSQEWSDSRVAGVSLGFDGQIYDKASGTYLTEVRCINKDRREFESPGRAKFEDRVEEWREVK